MGEYVIELSEICKNYDDQQVLVDVNLKVELGEFLTFLGPSGCGKTTLLRMISGFETPSTGSIYINGKDVSGLLPEARQVNTVFQSYALFPHMTVFENIAFGLRCKRVAKSEIKKRVEEVLAIVKLEQFANRKPAQLSGGQQQRVAIARAVVNKPLVLLLDEPLSALDYRLRKTMQLELKALQRELGITFIFVTHDQEEALLMSDRVVVMQDGKVQQIGTPREVYEEPCNLQVAKFIGEANIFNTRVVAASDELIKIELEGKQFTLENTKDFIKGDEIFIVVRPEDVEVWDENEVEGTNQMLPAIVDEVIYKGSTVDLIVKLPSGTRVSATEFFDEDDEKLDYKLGDQVFIEWYTGWEVLLKEEEVG